MESNAYTNEELKLLQKIELKTLSMIINICEKIDVEYFMIGGSALGAVRHGGFIPWDDDIDIGMTRENYEKFLREVSKHLPDGFSLQTPYNSKKAPYFYSKIRINNTKFIEYCNRKIKMNHGIYIDIFPFDSVPLDYKDYEKQFEKFQKLIRLFSLKQIPDISEVPTTLKDKLKSALRKIAHLAVKIIPHNLIVKKLDKCAKKYNNDQNSTAYSCLNFPVIKTEYVNKTDLYPLKSVQFENIKVFIPQNEHVYLTTHYGQYLQLPPKDKQLGHRPYIFSLGDEKQK